MVTINKLMYIMLFLACLLPIEVAATLKVMEQTRPDTIIYPAQASSVKVNNLNQTNESAKVEVLGIRVGGMFENAVPANNLLVNDKILILVSNPRSLLGLKPNDRSELILYADQLPLVGIRTTYFSALAKNDLSDKLITWPGTVWIPFIFTRDSTNSEAWNTLYRVTKWDSNTTRFHLSLGWEGMYPIPYGNKETRARIFVLQLYSTKIFWFLLGCYFGFLAFFIWLCKRTGLIREPDLVASGLGPFSLAQTQLAFWTVIIVGGFIYLTILTGLPNSLNDSSLLLLGITGGTTSVACVLDYFKREAKSDTKGSSSKVNQPRFVKPKRGFLMDISSDGVNLNMQRAQTILWNFVLGVYFIWYVITNKAMPEFSNTLLTLAGVSSLVYLSSKGPEKQSGSAEQVEDKTP